MSVSLKSVNKLTVEFILFTSIKELRLDLDLEIKMRNNICLRGLTFMFY